MVSHLSHADGPCVVLRTGIGLVIFALFEVFPLWAIASEEVGGLGLDEQALGTVLAGSALLQTAFSGFCMGKVVKRIGEIQR